MGRHLFVVPDDATWLEVAAISAASRISVKRDSELSPVGRALKARIAEGGLPRMGRLSAVSNPEQQ